MSLWDALPWLISIVGVVDMYLYAKKVRWVWWMTAANNAAWTVYVIHAGDLGFVPLGLITIGQSIYGWLQWGKEKEAQHE